MTRHPIRLTALACLVLCSACTESGPPPQPEVTPVDTTTAGSIEVEVTYSGEVPEPIEINMRAAAECAALHPEPVFDQPVQVSGRRLANVLVYIESGLGDRRFRHPTEPVAIDQQGCLYQPRVAALMVGQPLQFRNSDPEAHNVRGRPDQVDAWNFMMSRQSSERTLYFEESEIGVRVGCDIHPWMRAYVSILPHPYFGITGENGRVELQNVPPGDYVIATWHETLGERRREVTLGESGTASLSFEY